MKRGGLARICMQIRCFHYRSTIKRRERERERGGGSDEKVRETVLGERRGESMVSYRGTKYKREIQLTCTELGFFLDGDFFLPPLPRLFQRTIVTPVEITSVDVTRRSLTSAVR